MPRSRPPSREPSKNCSSTSATPSSQDRRSRESRLNRATRLMRVAVIGGGVMGAATSWRLAKRGADVVCFDRLSPPHAFGSSHGESRDIRSADFEGSHYGPLL